MPALKGAAVAEEDTPKLVQDEEQTPLDVALSHDPLPPPPEIHFTRPTSARLANNRDGLSSDKQTDLEREAAAGHGSGLAAGLTFVVSILAGLLAGGWLDQHFNHSSVPWGTMGMTIVGAVVGFTNMSRLLSRGGRRKP